VIHFDHPSRNLRFAGLGSDDLPRVNYCPVEICTRYGELVEGHVKEPSFRFGDVQCSLCALYNFVGGDSSNASCDSRSGGAT
jgi:hypothetical protein